MARFPYLPELIGDSPAMSALRVYIERAARTDAKVLLFGETGVGKEVVARLLHAYSGRRARAFVPINCSGIPETLLASELFGHTKGSFTGALRDKPGLVRQANGGTLFLDELGEMSLAMQAMLLRFTETGEIQPVGADALAARTDVRLITATNRDLRAQVEAGAFREDLYFRLNVIEIRIPPLRERGTDILQLFEYYLRQASRSHALPCPDIADAAKQVLCAYRWPGNVRELRNVTERLVLLEIDRRVTPDDLPEEVRQSRRPGTRAVTRRRAASDVHPRFDFDEASEDGSVIDSLWDRLIQGDDFWSAVHQAFKAHELSRVDLAALIDRGLRHTRGSYRALVTLFNLSPREYKRFHAFLYAQRCNLPVAPYRMAGKKFDTADKSAARR